MNVGFQIIDVGNHNFASGGITVPGAYVAAKESKSKILVLTNVQSSPTVAMSAVPVVASYNPSEPSGVINLMSMANETNVIIGQITNGDKITFSETPWSPA